MLAQNNWETTLHGLGESPMERLENKGGGSRGNKWRQTPWQAPGCWSPCAKKGTVEIITRPRGNHPSHCPGDGNRHRDTLKCQLVPGATEGERRGTSKMWTPNSVKTGGVCPQCWGTAVWSLSPSTSHAGDRTHSTWVCVTDSQCVQVTKIGHILPQSPFHGVLNGVRLGYGQGCPSLTCVPEHQSPGHAELSEGLRGLSLTGSPWTRGKARYAQQDGSGTYQGTSDSSSSSPGLGVLPHAIRDPTPCFSQCGWTQF